MPIIDYGALADKFEKELFDSKQISQKNKDLFQRFLTSYDVSDARRSIFLKKISFFLKSSPDVKVLFSDRDRINSIFRDFRNKYSAATCDTYSNVAIRFGRWLNDGELPSGFVDVVKQRKTSKLRRDLDASDMLTWKDGLKLADRSPSIQLKAIILTQLDAGFRPSEFVDLNYGDVSVLDRVVVFHVRKGKTGSRDVIAYRATPYFLRWYHSHPSKSPGDPLWVQEHAQPMRGNENVLKRYEYAAIRKRIASLAFKVGLTKPLDFYNLRHSSCALDKIDNLPEGLAADRHGHSVGHFTKVYGRLNTKDVIKRYKLHYGESVESESVPGNVVCGSCQYPNPSDSSVCLRCSNSLNVKENGFVATGKFEEAIAQKTKAEQQSKDFLKHQEDMIEMDSRLKAMDEALKARQAEIGAKILEMQAQAKELAIREIKAGLEMNP